MSEEAGGERTEAPTAKRKSDAIQKGDVLRSRDLATALVMLAGVAWMVMAGPALIRACGQVMATSFRFGRGDVEDFSPFRPLAEAGWQVLPSLF
ncbi:MAG TPA: EscU/YscU/HrcU family type III secretion system export apparatus switch protein, partial [Sphingomonas sp.]